MAPIHPGQNDPMREQLLGYLLDALDPEERQRVEDELQRNPHLQQEVELLHEALEPLEATDEEFEPPSRLAIRTSQFVMNHRRQTSAAAPLGVEIPFSPNRWSLADLTIAAGIFIAAAMLFFPAIQHSRTAARQAACQNNLRQLGVALTEYSQRNHHYFPPVPPQGNLAAAGVYAVQLHDNGFLHDPQQLLCPATEEARQGQAFRVPTAAELQAATGRKLEQLRRRMGGSYGYSLGYMTERGYQHVKNRGRSSFAIMADTPTMQSHDIASLNHGGRGQNVLYEDGHVRHLVQCLTQSCNDHIFLNDQGQMAAGVHPDDAVIGHSSASPLLRTVGYQTSGR